MRLQCTIEPIPEGGPRDVSGAAEVADLVRSDMGCFMFGIMRFRNVSSC